MRVHIGWTVIIFAGLLASCVTTSSPDEAPPVSAISSPPATVANQPTPVPIPVSPMSTPPPTPEKPAESAVADLAKRLGIQPEEIQVVSVVQTEMPVDNLGCPAPGREPGFTIPGIVMGYEVRLRHRESLYLYHVHGLRVIYCGQQE